MHYNPHCFNVSGSSIVLGSDLTLVRTLFMGPGLVVVGIYITRLLLNLTYTVLTMHSCYVVRYHMLRMIIIICNKMENYIIHSVTPIDGLFS
jgi:hypothetical protein